MRAGDQRAQRGRLEDHVELAAGGGGIERDEDRPQLRGRGGQDDELGTLPSITPSQEPAPDAEGGQFLGAAVNPVQRPRQDR